MTRQTIIVAVAAAFLACDDGRTPAGPGPAPGTPPVTVRVLLFTATAGFRHDSIEAAHQALQAMEAAGGLTVTRSEDVADLTTSRLDAFDVVMFGLTSGELPLDDDHKTALLAFVERGGGFVGAHSATDTLYTWPDYGQLVGAYFREHPWTQSGTVLVEDRTHPSTLGLAASFTLHEEFYVFQTNPRPRVHVLLSLDPASVGATGDFPLAWTTTRGAGRVYYHALGHFAATWADAGFRAQMLGGIRWTAGR